MEGRALGRARRGHHVVHHRLGQTGALLGERRVQVRAHRAGRCRLDRGGNRPRPPSQTSALEMGVPHHERDPGSCGLGRVHVLQGGHGRQATGEGDLAARQPGDVLGSDRLGPPVPRARRGAQDRRHLVRDLALDLVGVVLVHGRRRDACRGQGRGEQPGVLAAGDPELAGGQRGEHRSRSEQGVRHGVPPAAGARQPVPAVGRPRGGPDAGTPGARLADEHGPRRHPVATDEGGRAVDRDAGVDGREEEGLVEVRPVATRARDVHEQGVVAHVQPRRRLGVVDGFERRRGVPRAQLAVPPTHRDVAVQPTRGTHDRAAVAVERSEPAPQRAQVGHRVDDVAGEEVDRLAVVEEVLRQRVVRVPRDRDDGADRTASTTTRTEVRYCGPRQDDPRSSSRATSSSTAPDGTSETRYASTVLPPSRAAARGDAHRTPGPQPVGARRTDLGLRAAGGRPPSGACAATPSGSCRSPGEAVAAADRARTAAPGSGLTRSTHRPSTTARASCSSRPSRTRPSWSSVATSPKTSRAISGSTSGRVAATSSAAARSRSNGGWVGGGPGGTARASHRTPWTTTDFGRQPIDF